MTLGEFALTEAEEAAAIVLLAGSMADFVTDADRDLAKMILASKQHLGPLGMIEVALVMRRAMGEPKADVL